MPVSLLATKFYIPPGRPDIVARPRLTEKVLAGVNRPQTFTLLSGPAGSGKTTLLSQFVSQLRRPVAWLSLDEGDDDPARFWTYLIAACQSVLEGVGQSALALLEAPQPLPDDTIPTLLINDLAKQERALVLVLDDYHLIQDPSIHAGFSFLLDHLPDNLHAVISTRVDPPWPLPRYRARNQLVEIRARDLRFSLAETAEFLKRTMDLDLSAADVAALEARTEGWAAGLQLAALSMRGDGDAADFVRDFAGSHLYVAEYLVEEVLRRQPEDVQAFLLQTSILERLDAQLCDAVTRRQDGAAILTALHRANLFVIPLDPEGRWFRYHHLFADLLQARLPQILPAEAIAELHRRAASWYEQKGFAHEAIRHALAAGDFEGVALLVEQQARTMMFTGRASTLSEWLEALPPASFQAHPRLNVYRLWIELMQGKSDLSDQAVQEKENMLRALPPSPENDRLRVELMAVLCRFVAFSGNTSRAMRLAEEALARLPEGEGALRARAHSALAIAHWMEGHPEKARQAHDRCLHLAQAAGNYSLAAHATMIRAMEQADYGQLHEAARSYQSIIDMGAQAGQKIFFPAGQGYIGLAGIHLEWNDLQAAQAYLQQGMTLCRQGGLAGIYTGHTLKARLRQAKGDPEGALAEIRSLEQTSHGVNPTGTAREILLRVAMGDLDEASRRAKPWLEMLGGEPASTRPPLLVSEIIRIVLARLFLARQEPERALSLLDEVQATAGPGKRFARLLELYLLRAVAYQKQNQGKVTPQALEPFQRALELAEPEGYTLLFLEEGPALIPLLNAVVNHRPAPARLKQYAQNLLNAFSGHGQSAARAPGEAAGLVESLTPREMEVLQHIAAGESNQAIADRLFITVRTVKKHAGNIYGKLNVSRRTEAVARARQLGLLPTDD